MRTAVYNYVRVNVSMRGFYPIPLFCVRKVLLLLSCPVNADIVSRGLYISMWWHFIPVNHLSSKSEDGPIFLPS